MVRIILIILTVLFLLLGALLVDADERRGAMFFLFSAFFVGMIAGITLCKGPAVEEKTRKLLFW